MPLKPNYFLGYGVKRSFLLTNFSASGKKPKICNYSCMKNIHSNGTHMYYYYVLHFKWSMHQLHQCFLAICLLTQTQWFFFPKLKDFWLENSRNQQILGQFSAKTEILAQNSPFRTKFFRNSRTFLKITMPKSVQNSRNRPKWAEKHHG